MTYSRWIAFFVLLSVCCVAGCAWLKFADPLPEMNLAVYEWEIDGRSYECLLSNVYEKKNKSTYTTIDITPVPEDIAEQNRIAKAEIERMIQNGEEIKLDFKKIGKVGKGREVRPDFIQIVSYGENEVVFERPITELGAVCVDWNDKRFSEEQLKEAVAKIVREHHLAGTPAVETKEE